MDRENKIVARTAAQTAVLMAILTLGSKLLGFIREMVMAGFFGTSYITDAYVMAQSIPTVIFSGVFGAVAVAYMPIFSKEIEQRGRQAGNQFTSQVINVLVVASIISVFVGFVFSHPIVKIFASGFNGETAELTAYFLKVTFAYVLFTSVAGILESFLQYKNVFLPQIFAGYIQNIVVIATFAVSFYFSFYLLVYGLFIAYIIRLALILILAKNAGFKYSVELSWSKTIKKIVTMSLPIFIGSSVGQINLFVDKTLASRLEVGSVAALNYANLIISLITGLTVTILTTVIYPKMAQASATNNKDRLNDILGTGINLILMITIPFTLGTIAFNDEIIHLIYERGAFDSRAASLTSSALLFFALGMVFVSINTLIVQTYYLKYDTKTPLGIGIGAVSINIVLNLILVNPMHHNGLALATSISYTFNTVLLYLSMHKKHPEIIILKSKRKLLAMVLSAILSVGSAVIFYKFATYFAGGIETILLIISIMIAGIVYLLLLIAFKFEEINLLKQIFTK